MAFLDVVCAVLAPFVALALREPRTVVLDGAWGLPDETYFYAAVTIGCALLAIVAFRLADGVSASLSKREVLTICAAAAAASTSSAALTFVVTRLESIPRSTPLLYFLVLAAGLTGARAWSQSREVRSHRIGREAHANLRRVVLIGVDKFSSMAIRLMDCQSPRTVQIVAALDSRVRLCGRTVNGVEIVGAPEDLGSVIQEYRVHGVAIDEVWVSQDMPSPPNPWQRDLQATCDSLGVKFSSLSGALNLAPSRSTVLWPEGEPAERKSPSRYLKIKRVIDALAAGTLIVALAPVALVVAIVVAFDVGAPVIFWQERMGLKGRKFLLYKFRTYRAPFDRSGRPVAEKNRLSATGRFVRKTRLDEIPQLFNILRGDMSLIGPRPLLPVDQPANPRMRLSVRPGVTGWAQINGGALVTAEEKDALDVWYIRRASFGLDVRIVLRTLGYFIDGERRDQTAIDEALRARETARQVASQGPPASAVDGDPPTTPGSARRFADDCVA